MTGLALPNGVTSGYLYDDTGRLTTLTHTLVTTPLARYDYELDRVGNRRVLTENLVAVFDAPPGTWLETGGLVALEAENFVSSTASLTTAWQSQTGQSVTPARPTCSPCRTSMFFTKPVRWPAAPA